MITWCNFFPIFRLKVWRSAKIASFSAKWKTTIKSGAVNLPPTLLLEYRLFFHCWCNFVQWIYDFLPFYFSAAIEKRWKNFESKEKWFVIFLRKKLLVFLLRFRFQSLFDHWFFRPHELEKNNLKTRLGSSSKYNQFSVPLNLVS